MNNLTKQKIKLAHDEGLIVSSNYKKCEARLIEILIEMEKTKGFMLFGCESLRQYALTMWNLSENVVYDLITVAKKSCEIPEMLEALKTGRGTVAKLRKVCPVIDAETQKQWIDLVAESPTRAIEKAVATARPDLQVIERATYKDQNLIEIRTGISEQTWKDLERLKDLQSQSSKKAATLADVLQELAQLGLEKFDPIRKAQRSVKKAESKIQKKETSEVYLESSMNDIREKAGLDEEQQVSPPHSSRKRFSAKLVHAIHLRDQGQCTHLNPNGDRCSHRRWLDVHHIRPVSQGGRDELDNLTTLCANHHRMRHFQESMQRSAFSFDPSRDWVAADGH